MRYIYDDDEEEITDYYDDNPEDDYPGFIIGINDEKLIELYDEVKRRTQK